MVYNESFELGVLGALCEMFPDLAEDLGMIMKNVVDLSSRGARSHLSSWLYHQALA